jgi:HlyD family secretion protein
VVAGQAVLRLIDPASLWVKVRLDQGRSARAWPRVCRRIVLRSNPGRAAGRPVARVETMSDSVTEERVAQVAFDELPADLSVGELAEVTLSLPAHRPPCCCPTRPQRRGEQIGVWTLDGGACASSPVRTGPPAWTARCRCSRA